MKIKIINCRSDYHLNYKHLIGKIFEVDYHCYSLYKISHAEKIYLIREIDAEELEEIKYEIHNHKSITNCKYIIENKVGSVKCILCRNNVKCENKTVYCNYLHNNPYTDMISYFNKINKRFCKFKT